MWEIKMEIGLPRGFLGTLGTPTSVIETLSRFVKQAIANPPTLLAAGIAA